MKPNNTSIFQKLFLKSTGLFFTAFGMISLVYPSSGFGIEQTLLRSKPPFTGDAKPSLLEDLISEALSNSPVIHAARARFEASTELIEPSSALPDPELEFSLEENLRSVSSPDFVKSELRLNQGFPYPGKRGIKGKIAKAESDASYAAFIDTQRQVIKEIRTFFAQLYAIDSEKEVLEIARELMKLLEATAAARYVSGQGDQEAQIKAQLETSRILERIGDITSERKGVVAQLNRIMGHTQTAPIGQVTTLADVEFHQDVLEQADRTALSNTPSLHAGIAEVEAAEYRLELAKLDFRPDFFAGFGIALNAENESEAALSFGMTLPLWQKTKQKPLYRAAAAKLDESRKNLKALEYTIQADIFRLIAQWIRDKEQIRRYRDAILPQTSAALDSARASYLSGRASFSTVIEDYNLWLDARTRLARRESDRFITWTDLTALLEPYPMRTKKEETP
jgi:outer membrane protein TolC